VALQLVQATQDEMAASGSGEGGTRDARDARGTGPGRADSGLLAPQVAGALARAAGGRGASLCILSSGTSLHNLNTVVGAALRDCRALDASPTLLVGGARGCPGGTTNNARDALAVVVGLPRRHSRRRRSSCSPSHTMMPPVSQTVHCGGRMKKCAEG
jgi:hypothetical protein